MNMDDFLRKGSLPLPSVPSKPGPGTFGSNLSPPFAKGKSLFNAGSLSTFNSGGLSGMMKKLSTIGDNGGPFDAPPGTLFFVK